MNEETNNTTRVQN